MSSTIYSILIAVPVLLFLVLTLALALVARTGLLPAVPFNGRAPAAVVALLGAVIVLHLGYAFVYMLSPFYFDHIEPNVAAVSALFSQGLPVYPEIDAAPRYAMLYGPTQYLVNGLSYRLFGYNDLAFKLTGVVSLLLAYLFTGLSIARLRDARASDIVLGLGIFAVLALSFRNYTFWSKSDSMMLALTAVGVYSCFLRNPVQAALLCGVALGLTVNGKLHAFAYFLPLLAIHYRADGWRAVLIIGGSSLLVFLLPYLVFSNVSLTNYLAMVESAGKHGISGLIALANGLFGVFMALPLLCMGWFAMRSGAYPGWLRANGLVILATLAGVFLAALVGAKPGSGNWHLLPFLPLVAVASVAVLKNLEHSPTAITAWSWVPFAGFLGAALVKGMIGAYYGYTVSLNNFDRPQRIIDDVQELIVAHPDKNIHMGYGDGSNYVKSFARTQLVFAGEPYLLDAAAITDMRFSALSIPAATLEAMNSDPDALWLINKGQEPFTMPNWTARFGSAEFLFDEALRENFTAHFEKTGSTEYFDLWTPKAGD
jgi:hypothetical protein